MHWAWGYAPFTSPLPSTLLIAAQHCHYMRGMGNPLHLVQRFEPRRLAVQILPFLLPAKPRHSSATPEMASHQDRRAIHLPDLSCILFWPRVCTFLGVIPHLPCLLCFLFCLRLLFLPCLFSRRAALAVVQGRRRVKSGRQGAAKTPERRQRVGQLIFSCELSSAVSVLSRDGT
jgi:hypothetical protein